MSHGLVSNPEKLTSGEECGGPGRQSCRKFPNSPRLRGAENLEGTILAKKLTLVLGGYKSATDTEKGYEEIQFHKAQ